VVGAGSAAYHVAAQLADMFAVISVNEELNSIFLQPIRNVGCEGRMTSMQAIEKPLTMPMKEFYTPEELEEEFYRIGQKQVEEGARLIVIACTLVSLMVPPGGLERLSKKLGIAVLDPQPIAVKTLEMLVALNLSHPDHSSERRTS
jgi:Asp/Glu/hydantoin racemase